jgi:uncharacterized membrane protein
MSTLKLVLKYLMSVLFVLAGVYHFVNPDFYLNIMPPYFPWHLFLVYLTGAFEIIFGVLLAIPRFTRIAGFGLIVLLIVIFPANIHMAINAKFFPHINPIVLWLRLPLQFVLVAWAYWYTRPGTAGETPPVNANSK